MNNEVNNQNEANINQSNNNSLAPMAGVTIAPPTSEPVNASNSQTSTSALSRGVGGSTVTNGQTQTPQPQIMQQPHPQIQPQTVEQQAINTGVPTNNGEVPTQTVNTPPTNQQPPIEPKQKNKSFSLTPILLLIIVALGGYLFYSTNSHSMQIKKLLNNCTPVTASKEATKLDLNSTLVQDLYNKVKTNIKEDYANPELNDSMKIYLAYRQISDNLKISSNCNMFNSQSMEPYKCDSENNFVPKAIKEDIVVLELKKLFGENTNIPLQNIQLGSSCIGGYQYIPERGEFVQGYCPSQSANFFTVDKEVVEATSTRNTIVITEEVKYHENEKMSLPVYLKSGLYKYTFRLDLNYNYVLVSKTYQSKY